ncbi:DUF885 domain-containing protein [Demequina sp. B12]|uniref:DUF885 domain-containing protein n=1 Tax=Demequina sp. B12 TaxID=2992757 RepID=UPI00237BCFC6|nr:DUF885 domain-containing protein [Demequina sp. B12]MDE0572014.1 DUF885 domain-containing protein [Demequina sp. B12]
MTALTDLADEYYAYRQSTDLFRLLWDGSLENLDQWEDVSPGGIAQRQERLRDFVERAHALEIDESNPHEVALRDTVAVTAHAADLELQWSVELNVVNPRIGVLSLAEVFLSRFPLKTDEHGEQYLAKVAAFPALLDDIMAAVQAAALEGRVTLATHLRQTAEALLDLTQNSAPLTAQAAPTESSDADAWKARLDDVVATEVVPALQRTADALADVAARGRGDDEPGLVHVEGGAELYEQLVRSYTTLPMTAQEVHDLGLRVIDELEAEYRQLAGPLLGTQDNAEIYRLLRDDESMHYTSGEAIVADATTALERAQAAAPEWFARMPVSPCVALAIESGPVAFYAPPSQATGKPGEFFFNASNPAAWSTYELEAIAFHEAIPGHHLQFAFHEEAEDLHPVVKHFGVTAYLEGWGLYTERLADEMGLYSSDLARVGMLAADSLRACRLVVDTGMHALGWTRQEAIDYMVAHCPLSTDQIVQEIDRYIGLPGQALAYMVGRREIESIRAEAEAYDGFDIREFHDALLRYGMVPLTTLRRIVALTRER